MIAFWKNRIVHSGDDRSQTSEEFNAFKSTLTESYENVRNMMHHAAYLMLVLVYKFNLFMAERYMQISKKTYFMDLPLFDHHQQYIVSPLL